MRPHEINAGAAILPEAALDERDVMDLATPAAGSGRQLDAAERALRLGQLDECKAWLAKCSEPASMRQRQLHTALALLTCTSDRDWWKVSGAVQQGVGSLGSARLWQAVKEPKIGA